MGKYLTQLFAGLRAIAIGMSVTLKNNFRKPVTIHYGFLPKWRVTPAPPTERGMAPRYRGRFALIREPETGELRCTGCKMCAQACPGRCIEVAGENRKVTLYRMELEKCLFCGLCVEACPFEALGMLQETLPVQTDRGGLHMDLAALSQPAGTAMPGVLPSTVGAELRPGKKPFVPKTKKADDGGATASA
jgi:formate hydrogenlyase subunit 6/NADH:ubiquinone oxidoreductase subunit I